MAFYPGQEEMLIASRDTLDNVDFFHMMSYDQPNGEHSGWKWMASVVRRLKATSPMPWHKVTLGLPFYGRDVRTSEAATYNDLLRDNPDIDEDTDLVGTQSFNGPNTIRRKTTYAWQQGLGGVMIWEVGQDAHPSNERSLSVAVSQSVDELYRLNDGGDATEL